MSPGIARRTFLQAMAAAVAVILTRPTLALGDGRNILDGGPWLANVEKSSLADAAKVADAWGRRGLRVLVALGPAAERDAVRWTAAMVALGWQVAAKMSTDQGKTPGVAASVLRHPDARRGYVSLHTRVSDPALSGGEAAILDGCGAVLAQAVVYRAIAPWATHHWVGTLYRRWRPGMPLDLQAIHERAERLLGFDPTRRAPRGGNRRSAW